MADADVVISIKAEIEDLKGNVEEAKKQLDKLNESVSQGEKSNKKLTASNASLSDAIGAVKIGWIAAAAALGTVVKFSQEATNAYNEQLLANKRLEVALRNQKIYTEALQNQLTGLASELQRTTQFTDEQIISAQALLINYRMSAEQVKTFTPLLLDMAAMSGRAGEGMLDLSSSARLVAMALDGSVDRLRMAGVSLSALDEETIKYASRSERVILLQKMLQNSIGGVAEEQQKVAGATNRAKKAWGEFMEEVGTKTKPMTDAITDAFSKSMENMTKRMYLQRNYAVQMQTIGQLESQLFTAKQNNDIKEYQRLQSVINKEYEKIDALEAEKTKIGEVDRIMQSFSSTGTQAFDEVTSAVNDLKRKSDETKTSIAGIQDEINQIMNMSFEGETQNSKDIIKKRQEINKVDMDLIAEKEKATEKYYAATNQEEKKAAQLEYEAATMNADAKKRKLETELKELQTLNEGYRLQGEEVRIAKKEQDDLTFGTQENASAMITALTPLWEEQNKLTTELLAQKEAIKAGEDVRKKLIEDNDGLTKQIGTDMVEALDKFKKKLDEIPNVKNIQINVSTNSGMIGNIIAGGLSGTGDLNSMQNRLSGFGQNLPKAATGGYVARTGAAIIHKGETIVPADKNSGGITVNIGNIYGTNPQEIARSIRKELMLQVSY